MLVNLRLRPLYVKISTEAKQDINHVQRQHYSVFVFYSVQNKILLTYIAWHTFKYHPCVFHAKTWSFLSPFWTMKAVLLLHRNGKKISWTVRKVGHEYGLDPKPIREVTKSDDASFLNANK